MASCCSIALPHSLRACSASFPSHWQTNLVLARCDVQVRLAYDAAIRDAKEKEEEAAAAAKDAALTAEAEAFLRPKGGARALHLEDPTSIYAPPPPPLEEEEAFDEEAFKLSLRPVWEQEAAARAAEPDPSVAWLRARGYDAADAAAALLAAAPAGEDHLAAGADVKVVALATLHRAAVAAAAHDDAGEPLPALPTDTELADEEELGRAAAEREEERECLEAIYDVEGGELRFADPANAAAFDVAALAVVAYEAQPGSRAEDGAPALTIEVYADHGVAPLYPGGQPPVLALVGGGLAEETLRTVAASLGRHAVSALENGPLTFELATMAADEATAAAEAEGARARAAVEAAKKAHAARQVPARAGGAAAAGGAPSTQSKLTEEQKAVRRAARAADAKKRLGAFYDPLAASALKDARPTAKSGKGDGGGTDEAGMMGVGCDDGFGDDYGDGDGVMMDDDFMGVVKVAR